MKIGIYFSNMIRTVMPLKWKNTKKILLFASASIFLSVQAQFDLEFVTKRPDVVWGFDFLDNDRIIYTEREGDIGIYNMKSKANVLLALPDNIKNSIYIRGQAGLLDIIQHKIGTENWIYMTYSKKARKGATTALARFQITADNKITNFSDIFVAQADTTKNQHFGSRIAIDKNNKLFMSVGDRNTREEAQKLNTHIGKVLRLELDGKASAENPFSNDKSALPEIWSYGHRNPQGLVFSPNSEQLWSCEFGPRGGDELNLIQPGLNYGWPIVTYGREYWGPRIGEGTTKKGMQDPVEQWTPSISPSGMSFYTGDKIPEWKNQLFLANLAGLHIRRLKLENNRVVEQEALFSKEGIRFRQVRTGPDGYLYFSADDGRIGRVIKK